LSIANIAIFVFLEGYVLTINERIKDLLRENNKKQTDLAEYIGVSQNTISDWVNKGKNPSANLMYRISDFFGVSFEYLFTGIELKKADTKLSADELELLENYNKLSNRSKHRLHTFIYNELDSTEKTETNSSKNAI